MRIEALRSGGGVSKFLRSFWRIVCDGCRVVEGCSAESGRGREVVVVDGVGGEKLRVEIEKERLLRVVGEKEYEV